MRADRAACSATMFEAATRTEHSPNWWSLLLAAEAVPQMPESSTQRPFEAVRDFGRLENMPCLRAAREIV